VNDPNCKTIGEAIAKHATLEPERPALVCANLPVFSFHELDTAIKLLGKRMRASGIGAASRVGVVLPNGPEAAIVGLAISAHAIGFSLNPALSASDYESECKRAGLDAVILADWIESPATAVARQLAIGIFYVSKVRHSLAEIDLKSAVQIPLARRRLGVPTTNSISVIQTSSGSTGVPKLILVTHANLFDVAGKMQRWFYLTKDDRSACILPIYSGFGFKIALVAPLLLGASVALPSSQGPESILAWSPELDPTWFVATPTFLHAIFDHIRSGNIRHTLRFFASTSAYLPESVRIGLESVLAVPALEFYGLREAGIVAANPAPPARRKPGTVGLFSSNDVAIFDDNGEVLPPDTTGMIAVRGRGVSPGYIEALPLGREAVPGSEESQSRWTLTGDIGFMDTDGFLSIVGRAREIINRGGEKISPYEIEKELLRHHGVREAAVFATSHPRLGENVAAAIVLQPGATPTSFDLQRFLHTRLAHSKIPQHVHLLESLPRGRTGKIDRAKLSELLAEHVRAATPPQTSLESDILNIWRRLLRCDVVGVDDNFFEAGGDSLLAAQMLLEVEDMTGRRMSRTGLEDLYSIRELASAVATAPLLKSEVVTYSQRADGIPFFYCHGDFDTRGFYVPKFLEGLGDDKTVFVINPWQSGNEIPTIEEMAQAYAPELAARYPEGPFRLGGMCNGGLLAWALAHELEKMGRQVELVAVINSFSLNARPVVQKIEKALKFVRRIAPLSISKKIESDGMGLVWEALQRLNQPGSRIFRWALRQTGGIMRWSTRNVAHSEEEDDRFTLHQQSQGARYFSIMSQYVPPKIDCTLLCLTCDEMWDNFSHSQIPWRQIARHVYAIRFPGTHETAMTTNLAHVATILREYLI
jgi:acyl-CoA synthetase (AMP-forming)/AMP-acid ligase II/thioesterase domain-containing protein